MTFSALDSGLTGPLFASDAMRAVFSDRAALTAMLAAETALARAEGAAGLVPKGLAPALARIKADDLDIAALGARTRDAGVVAIPFVKAVEALLPDRLRAHLHKGATSQDIVDTALVLQMAQAFALIAADLAAILDGLSAWPGSTRAALASGAPTASTPRPSPSAMSPAPGSPASPRWRPNCRACASAR